MRLVAGRADSSANGAMKAAAAIPVLLCVGICAGFPRKNGVPTTHFTLTCPGTRRGFDMLGESFLELPRSMDLMSAAMCRNWGVESWPRQHLSDGRVIDGDHVNVA